MTTPGRRRRWTRWLGWALVALAAALAGATLVWVLLLPEAEPGPLEAVLADPDLAVTVDDDGATIAPSGLAPTTTVVFYPGAGVPPAAYLATWAPVVAETGVRVVVPAMPLGLAVLDSDAAAEVRAADDAGGTWWVGGHSLGGAMAASFLADTEPGPWAGLVLWAAYPAGDGLAGRDDVAVVSVAGSRDALTTPAEVAASTTALPPSAVVTMLDGVTHAQFGAYGDQRGDGEPTVSDDEARALVADATSAALRD